MEKSMIIEDERGKSYVLTISIREVSDAAQGSTSAMTFAELADEYLQVYAPDRLKPGTVQTYKTAIGRYLLPTFGKMYLSDISPQVISEKLSRAHLY